MKQLAVLVAIVAAGLGALTVGHASADDCVTLLNGSINAGECQVTGTVSVSGTVSLDETLHIFPTGKILVPFAAGGNILTLNICATPSPCDLIMDSGALISGDVTGTGARVSATININATRFITLHGTGAAGATISSQEPTGGCANSKSGDINLEAGSDIVLEAGTLITVDAHCSAGAITIISASSNVTSLGTVSSASDITGTSVGRPGGGPITIIARCNLTVGGLVQSVGLDPGADLIHLEGGCDVVINGIVRSTGGGHGPPSTPPNHCNNTNRPDKPTSSSACVEVWSGTNLTINATAEVHADTGGPGGNTGTGWVDLFARNNIVINGDANQPFAVHANGLGGSGGGGEAGGLVTVKSVAGQLSATGLALQASSFSGTNSDGGQITAEAAGNVVLDGATLEAKGTGTGGTIAVRSFTGTLSWQNGVGDDTPIATGSITLTSCGAITTTGTNFKGESVALAPGVCNPTAPTLPTYVTLPTCICGLPGQGGPCPEDPNRVLTRTVDPTGTTHGAVPNHLTLGAAVQSASVVENIGMFGNTTENVSIPSKKLLITQCTLAQITAADNTKAVVDISSHDTTTIISLDTVGGTVGWLVESDDNDIRSVRAASASLYGIRIAGNNNRVSFNEVTQNGLAGVRIDGATNNVRGGTVDANPGDGVELGASSSANTFQGSYVQNNGGNGIVVDGTLNKIVSNSRVDNNTLNGILVIGSGNTIKGNITGSGPGLGNGQDGIKVTGSANLLDSNKSSANKGDGFDIAGGVAGAANKLRGNQSNLGNAGGARENVGAEYRLNGTVTSQGSNKADGIGVPKFSNPQKCTFFPLAGQTVTFGSAMACE